MKAKKVRAWTAAVAGVLMLGMAGTAGAAVVVYKDNGFVYGDTPTYSTNEFTISDPGTYTATLADFQFPQSLDQLGLLVTDGGTQELGRSLGPGSFNFDAQPGTYTAALYGVAGGALQLGYYGVNIQLGDDSVVPTSPVILPSTIVLLATGLIVFGGVARRRRDWSTAAVAA